MIVDASITVMHFPKCPCPRRGGERIGRKRVKSKSVKEKKGKKGGSIRSRHSRKMVHRNQGNSTTDNKSHIGGE
ncbi:MAG: hypothetical protein ACMUEL_00705 [Flavobacteriales bacterium Tduv]